MSDRDCATLTRPLSHPVNRTLGNRTAFVSLLVLAVLFATPGLPAEHRLPTPKSLALPVPTPRTDAPHPCVFASLYGTALFTALGKCSAPPTRSTFARFTVLSSEPDATAFDHFEADLRTGTFVARQTDLLSSRNGAMPLTRSYVSQARSTGNPVYGFGPNMEDSLHLTPRPQRRARGNTGVNVAQLTSPGSRIHLAYDDRLRVREARDDRANAVRYIYNRKGMLSYAFNSSGVVRHYLYDQSLMTAIEDENGNTIVHNWYRAGMLSAQQYANGDVYGYTYNCAPGNSKPESVTVTLPDHSERLLSLSTSESPRP